jgi:hypothetical protein
MGAASEQRTFAIKMLERITASMRASWRNACGGPNRA